MSDPRLQADAALLQDVLEGRIDSGDARVRELLERRPEWRELQAGSESDLVPGTRDGLADSSEEDRRLVAECLAEARAGAQPRAAGRSGAGGKPRTLPMALLALAAALLLLLLARTWLTSEKPSVQTNGEFLGGSEGLDCLYPGETTPDFDRFEWAWKNELEPKGSFVLTIWAQADDGTRGRVLLEPRKTRQPRVGLTAEERAGWPERILWRVEVFDSNNVPGPFCEGRSRRSPH